MHLKVTKNRLVTRGTDTNSLAGVKTTITAVKHERYRVFQNLQIENWPALIRVKFSILKNSRTASLRHALKLCADQNRLLRNICENTVCTGTISASVTRSSRKSSKLDVCGKNTKLVSGSCVAWGAYKEFQGIRLQQTAIHQRYGGGLKFCQKQMHSRGTCGLTWKLVVTFKKYLGAL